MLKLRDVLAIGVLSLPLAAIAIASIRRADEMDNRIRCASNLRSIGQAMLLYAQVNQEFYPRGPATSDKPEPVFGTPYEQQPGLGVADRRVSPFPPAAAAPGAVPLDPNPFAVSDNDVTAAIFVLLRVEDFSPEVFICPSAAQRAMPGLVKPGEAERWVNFVGKKGVAAHLSYSIHNPYADRAAIEAGAKWNTELDAEFATFADMNPGGDAVMSLTIHSDIEATRLANSLNHGRDGQNVLYGDGHVEFQQSPLSGAGRDNIYSAGPSGMNGNGPNTIEAGPVDGADSILLPTAAWAGITATDDQLRERLVPGGPR